MKAKIGPIACDSLFKDSAIVNCYFEQDTDDWCYTIEALDPTQPSIMRNIKISVKREAK